MSDTGMNTTLDPVTSCNLNTSWLTSFCMWTQDETPPVAQQNLQRVVLVTKRLPISDQYHASSKVQILNINICKHKAVLVKAIGLWLLKLLEKFLMCRHSCVCVCVIITHRLSECTQEDYSVMKHVSDTRDRVAFFINTPCSLWIFVVVTTVMFEPAFETVSLCS